MQQIDFQKLAMEIQNDFQEKIQKCVLEGKADEIPKLVAEMRNRISDLMVQVEKGYSPQAPPVEHKPVYDDVLSSLHLDHYAYPSDKEFYSKLETRDDMRIALAEWREHRQVHLGRRRLLANAMRLTPSVSKPFFEIVDRCKKTLGFKGQLDLFVVHDNQFNAGVFPLAGEKLPIYFTSGLLENFSHDELAFVIGHEIGHALFHHVDVSVQSLLESHGHMFSPRDIISMRSWQRATELSADRMGLLCAGNFDAACVAFFKLSSGITSSKFSFSMNDYMEQYKDLESYMKSGPPDQIEELYSTHPLNPVRLRALELFSQSKLYHVTLGLDANHAMENHEMESKIRSFVQLLEPTYLEDKSGVAATIKEFMFLTGFMLSKSDGNVDPAEIEQLSKLLDSNDTAHRISALMNMTDEGIINQIVTCAEKIQFEVSGVHRLNIIRDVFSIAAADGKIEEGEIHEMAKICGVLGISPGFIEELVRSVTSEAA